MQNFLSIGNVAQTVDLGLNGLTLVLGENVDITGGNSRNGAGKTSLLQAVCYGLFGKPLTKIRLDNLVNSINMKGMLIIVDFTVDGQPYRIERGRKPNVLRFFRNGVSQLDEAQGENKHTQAEIERLIGMSHTLFRHIVAVNTSTTPFLREEAAVQRDVIEELFGITQLSQRAETLKKLIDATKDRLRDAEATVKANSEANTRIEQAINRATTEGVTWRTVQDRRITELANQVKTLHAIDIDAEIAVFDQIDQWHERKREQDTRRETIERQIAAITNEIARRETDVARYAAEQPSDSAEIIRLTRQVQLYLTEAEQDIQPQIDRLRSEVVRFQQQAASKYAEANQLAVELIDVDDRLAKPDAHHCATCGQGLAGTDHLAKVVANLTRQQTHLTEKITHLLTEHEQAKRDAEVAEADIGQLAAADKTHRDDMRAKAADVQAEIAAVQTTREAQQTETRRKIEQLDAEIAELRQERTGLTERLLALPDLEPAPVSNYKSRDVVWLLRNERDQLLAQLEVELDRPNPFDDKIEALRSTLVAIDYAVLNDLNNRYKHETFLHKLLTAKDSFIRKRIIDQNLSYLNKRLDHYLQRLGLPHEVTFIADLSVEISLLGASFDFEQLSRGEQNRVVLATAWAFGDVWQNLNTALSLLFLDEMLDQGTDGAGVEAAMDILATMAADQHRSVFLISHREELRDRIDNIMVVRKESHFTSFA